jgi:hypothetical protein
MNTDALNYAVRATVPRPLRNWLRSPSHSAEWLWDAVRFSLGSVESFEIVPNLRLPSTRTPTSFFCNPRSTIYAANVAVNNKCQPNRRSSDRNIPSGIHRKYQFRTYRYFT